MYFRFYRAIILGEIAAIRKGTERQFDMTVPRLIAKEENKSVFGTWLKMVLSLVVTGCTFKEYYNLNFINRTLINQKTFITTGSNLDAYSKLNDKSCYHFYINKNEFNEKYSEFVARDWISMSDEKEKVYSFFNRHENIILKPNNGNSGTGISIIRNSDKLTVSEIDSLISENKACIAEELLYNHSKINELNKSSLNTMRVITLRNGNDMEILFAGIRFGAKGCEIDNISTGGRIAPIDIISGKICANSHTKKSVSTDGEKDSDYIGFEIPMWNDLYDYLYRLTSVIPRMRYMAWDIAITGNGFVTIEGNHSSGNTVTQAHLGLTQQGLRVKLNKFMSQIKK